VHEFFLSKIFGFGKLRLIEGRLCNALVTVTCFESLYTAMYCMQEVRSLFYGPIARLHRNCHSSSHFLASAVLFIQGISIINLRLIKNRLNMRCVGTLVVLIFYYWLVHEPSSNSIFRFASANSDPNETSAAGATIGTDKDTSSDAPIGSTTKPPEETKGMWMQRFPVEGNCAKKD